MNLERLEREKKRLKLKKNLYTLAAAGITVAVVSVPQLCVTGLLAALTGRTPFRDKIKHTAHIKTEFNSDEKLKVTKQYSHFDSDKSYLYYDTMINDDPYAMTRTIYNIDGLTYDEVINSIDKDGNITLGNIVSQNTIYNEPVSENVEKGPYYEGVLYSEDKNDIIVVAQSRDDNLSDIAAGFICGSPLTMPLTYCAYAGAKEEFHVDKMEKVEYKMTKAIEEKKKKLVKKLS